MARARHRGRARRLRDAGGGGAARRAARPRFLRHLALRQSEAVGDRRAAAAAPRPKAISSSRSTIPPRRRGRRASSTRSTCCAALKARGDAGRLRPRGRARRRGADADDARRSGPQPRRHGDAGHRRLERDALHRARRRQAVDADAALLWSGAMSCDPGHDGVEVVQRLRRPAPAAGATMTTSMPSVARRLDLGVGRAPAAVLGDQRLDPLAPASARVRRRARTGPRARISLQSGRASISAGRSIARTM